MRRWTYGVLPLLLLALIGIPFPASSAPTPQVRPPEGMYVVTIYAPTPQQRTELVRAGFDVMGVDVRAGTMTLRVSTRQWQHLKQEGWTILDRRPLEFPPNDAGYHDYAEMVAEIRAAEAAYPDIVRVGVYGRSVEGRDLYVVKISDHVEKDESAEEPGVLLFANIHAREHLTAEQALWVIRHLTENYGRDPAVTNLVNEREIWIMPMTNPDGVEYDISKTGLYRWWRKNRRRNPDGSFGVDLNRNFGYKWGCCGGSTTVPYLDTYRGPAPFSEPETRAIRDFFLAHPSIRVSLNFHSYSELVLWPYGYTTKALPPDMDPIDYEVMRRAGTRMARLSGYTPGQASKVLYIADGTSDDWVYGALRIPTWTVELYPTRTSPLAFYPPDEDIPAQTARNKDMVEYLIALADEPRKILGLAGDLITPTVSLTLTHSTSPVTFAITVQDNAGATLVALREGETPLTVMPTDTAIAGTARYTVTLPLSAGEHVIQALAYDRAHNLGVSAPLTVTVSAPAPAPPSRRAWFPWLSREENK